MVSRKLERLISPESGYIIYQSSLYRFFQLVYFFVLSESVAYLIFGIKLKTILPMCLFALNRS